MYLFNYDFNMVETFERGHEFNLILGWCDDKYFRRFGALRESYLDVLHKGATYEGSGMPDTRRDLFSLSTTTGPLAATVRENINSIRTSCWWLRMLRPRFHGIDVPDNSHCLLLSIIRFIRFHSLRNIEVAFFTYNTDVVLHGKKGKHEINYFREYVLPCNTLCNRYWSFFNFWMVRKQ